MRADNDIDRAGVKACDRLRDSLLERTRKFGDLDAIGKRSRKVDVLLTSNVVGHAQLPLAFDYCSKRRAQRDLGFPKSDLAAPAVLENSRSCPQHGFEPPAAWRFVDANPGNA